MRRSCCDELDEEVLLIIFGHLPFAALAECRRTCRAWRGLAKLALAEWGRRSDEPEAAACMDCHSSKDAVVGAMRTFIGDLRFRPNLGVVMVSSSFSAKVRDKIVAAVGALLPADLVLAGTSCAGGIGGAGALGEANTDRHKPLEREGGHFFCLQLQYLPKSKIHFFAMHGSSLPIVNTEPAMRLTRSGLGDQARASYLDMWVEAAAGPQSPGSPVIHASMLAFSTAPNGTEDATVIELLTDHRVTLAGGLASGSAPRVYLYCGDRGGLLGAGSAPLDEVVVCVSSETVAMRTCSVCEEWGTGLLAQTAAMRLFVSASECNHFNYRLHASGPELARVHGAMVVSCVGRGRDFHLDKDCESRALLRALGSVEDQAEAPAAGRPRGVPLTGFFSNGEIGPVGCGRAGLQEYACVVALFGTARAESAEARQQRMRWRCGFKDCRCRTPSPFDDDYMAHIVPFNAAQPLPPPAGAPLGLAPE